LQEGDGEEDGSGQERGDGDGDPHLLGPTVDLGGELALDLSSYGAGLLGDQPAEVAGVSVQGQDAHQAVDRVDVGQVGPFAERLGVAQSLPDPKPDLGEISRASSATTAADPVERRAEAPAMAGLSAADFIQRRPVEEEVVVREFSGSDLRRRIAASTEEEEPAEERKGLLARLFGR